MARYDIWQDAPELDEKALDEQRDDVFVLRGWAATYAEDKIKDIIVPGAFKKSLDRMAKKGEKLQLYFNHKTDEAPLGVCEVCEERGKGLYYEAHMPKDDEFVAKRIVPQIKRRSLKANSFGFKVKDFERKNGSRFLRELDIFEISVVGFPCGNGADILGVKGLIPFQDLPIDRSAKSWDAAAALARIKATFGDNDEDVRRAFLYAEEGKGIDELDTRFLIADLDENGDLTANSVALYKCAASICGARGGAKLPEEAAEGVKGSLDRYYHRLDLASPFSSLSDGEFWALAPGEREARLKSLGLSRKLASTLSGLRDADRNPAQRDAGANEDAKSLLTAFTSLMEAAAAIHKQTAG